MKTLFCSLLLLISLSTFSQSTNYSIKGFINSKTDAKGLEAATVHLEKLKDSTILTYTISDKTGKFTLEGKSFETSVRLVVSFIGYESFSKVLDFEKNTFDLGTILLEEKKNLLDEIVLKSRAPITIKKDTLEFNVNSFKTKKDANVEDLLKKLPGVEVDEEGAITINGKPVNKILVNGKPFFGNDPSITTKNLTKDIIEKVQITDTKTKSEAFTGEKGDSENKTINLTIKKDKNKGYFGRVSASKGTDDLYEFAGILNRFNDKKRISILLGGNNTNSPGFSFGEIRQLFSGGGSFNGNGSFSVGGINFGSGRGITTSQNAGLTYADTYGKWGEVNGDYFYANAENRNASKSNRETFLPDGSSFFSTSSTEGFSANKSNRFNIEADIKIDSTLLINIEPSFNFSTRESTFTREEASRNSANALINESTSANFSASENRSFQNELDITKLLNSKGGFLKLNLGTQVNTTTGEDRFNNTINIFGANPRTELQNQRIDDETSLESFNTRFIYRHALIAKKLFLDAKYSYRKDKRINERSTFDIDPTTNVETFNTTLSTNFSFNDIQSYPSLEISYRKKDMSASLEGGVISRTLENDDVLRPTLNLKRDFSNLQLNGRFYYRFSRRSSMYSGFSIRNTPPQLNQLSPFINQTNPLNIVEGNPNLKPANVKNMYFGFNKFNFQTGLGIYTNFNTTFTNNQVVSKSIIDENLIRNTTFENVNGNYSIRGGITLRKTIKLDTVKTITPRIGISLSKQRAANFFNGLEYNSNNTSFTPNLGLQFLWKGFFEINPRYFLSTNSTEFNIANLNNQSFTRHRVRIRTKTFAPKKLEWENDINYIYNTNVAPGFQKSSWFWNTTLAYIILKDKAILKLRVYDVLNQNTNAQRTATQNFIEDSESTVLQQYFMLSFSWKFNTLGSKAPSNNRGRGRYYRRSF